MDSLKQVELIQAKQLIDESLYDEALLLIKDLEEKGVLNLYEKILSQLLKCDIFIQRGLYDRAFKLAEQAYKDSSGLGKNLISVDALLLMAEAGLPAYPFEKLREVLKQAEESLDKFTNLTNTEYNRRKAYILYLKGRYYAATYLADRLNKSKKCLEQSLNMRRELGFKRDIISSLISLSIHLGFEWEIDRGLNYANESLKLAKEIKNRYLIASSMKTLMLLHAFKGELDRGLSYAEQSLALFEQINHTLEVARVLTQIGDKYMRKGDFEQSLEYLERSLVLYKNLNFPDFKAVLICTLIEVNIALPNIESANYYLKQLEQLYEQNPSKWIEILLRNCRALILKSSLRVKDRVKAEKLYKDLIDEYGDDLTVIDCYIQLCDLLLFELKITNDVEVLKEIESYVNRLLRVSKKSNSYWILGETYLLQAKLALIKLDLNEARRLLTGAQRIAEKYNLPYLAMKISHEHDELLKELGKWEYFKQTKASLEKRMQLSRLSEHMDLMVKKRIVEPKEFLDEDPVFILIIAEGGVPIFSQSFEEEWSFENHLFGGLLTAINTFSDEIFSKGLDRASFGEYTVILKSVPPFLVCYIFKGQSYQAQRRIGYFVDTIQKEKAIWRVFQEFYQTNQEVQLRDIPSLKPLITEVFIDKKISLA